MPWGESCDVPPLSLKRLNNHSPTVVAEGASAKRTAPFPEIFLIYWLSSITASSYGNALVVLCKNKTVGNPGPMPWRLLSRTGNFSTRALMARARRTLNSNNHHKHTITLFRISDNALQDAF
jgi:hypothetical protein